MGNSDPVDKVGEKMVVAKDFLLRFLKIEHGLPFRGFIDVQRLLESFIVVTVDLELLWIMQKLYSRLIHPEVPCASSVC
jgi:hypothetical protein